MHGKILDAGTGHAHSLRQILKTHDAQVVSVDLSEEKIEMAREIIRESGQEHRVTFIQTDLTKLPFEDNEFDVVVASNTLHHVANWKHALSEFVRVSNGTIIIQEFTPLGKRVLDSLLRREKGEPSHSHTHDGIDLQVVLKEIEGQGTIKFHRGLLTDVMQLRLS